MRSKFQGAPVGDEADGEDIPGVKRHNEGGQEVDFTWGHHPAFGWPFIDESCRIDLPACRIRTIEDYTPPSSRLKSTQLRDWPMAEAAAGGNAGVVVGD